ncbi:MAG: hypothetical protein ACKVY0_20620 [Prosthecobacter sp.]|uniref:hypothetical protein n=1 Tax=Prosthecobacter sp. TaxID=1965333 RepID=UPI0038FD9521
MPAESEQIEHPPRISRRLWWVLALVAALLVLMFIVAYDSRAIVLSDGTEVRYLGFVRGQPLPHSEFEEAIYAYSQDNFDPPGTLEVLERAFKQRGIDQPEYCHAPLLVLVPK